MSLFSKIKKGLKKIGKVLPVSAAMLPTKGGAMSALGTLQYGAPVAMPGAGAAMPGGSNPLAMLGGFLGGKIGLPENLSSALVSNLLPIPGGTVVDDLRAYGAYKLAPDSLLQQLNFAGGGVLGKKRRRMNPLNAKAAKRAIRRIKAVRKITAGIERALPKAKARGFAHWGHHHHRR